MKRAMGWLLVLLGLTMPLSAMAADITMEIEAGGLQVFDGDVPRDAFLNEYGSPELGSIVPMIRVQRLLADDPLMFSMKGKNLTRDDQAFWGVVEHARYGRMTLQYVQTPHHYFNGARYLLNPGHGVQSLDPSVRAAIEAAINGGNATDPSVAALIRGILGNEGRQTDIGTLRRAWDVGGESFLGANADVSGHIGYAQRLGSRLTSAGTYRRVNLGLNLFDRERFDSRGSSLLETIDDNTLSGGVSTQYRAKRGFVKAGVDVSIFRNQLSGLQWDNPFEAPGSVSSTSDRGRFARGQLGLAPDNESVRGHVTSAWSVASKTRVTATAAMSRMTQDQAFLPVTLNEALLFPGADLVAGTSDDVAGTNLSLLPRSSLEGEVNTMRLDMRVASTPVDRLSVQVNARMYKYDNKTPRLDLPGYAAFGESAFRKGIGQKINGRDTLYSHSDGYDQLRMGASLGYSLRPEWHATLGLERLTTNYDGRQVEATNDNVVTARLRGAAGSVDGSAHVQFASRRHDGEYEVGLETSRLRMFDVWDRDRMRFGADLNGELAPGVVAGISGAIQSDDYPGKVTGATFDYGLNSSSSTETALFLSYVPEKKKWSLALSGGMDDSEWESLIVTKTTLGSESVNFDPANRWNRTQEDQLLWAMAEWRGELVPGKWTGRMSYGLNAYTGDVATSNPATPNINSAVAVDWSEIKTTWQEVKVSLDRQLAKGVSLGMRYAFSPFALSDPAWDALQPYMQGVSTEVRSSASDIRAAEVARYLFMDARQDDVSRHMIGVVVSASFK